MKRHGIVAFMVVVALGLSLAACGGGGGTGAATSGGTGGIAAGAATVQGQVSGTVFVAVDNDTNVEAGRVAAAGTPKMFSLDVPTGRNYKFYLLENGDSVSGGRIYPVYVGGSNVFRIDGNASGRTIDLGKVDPDFSKGYAFPANNPMGTPGVTDRGEDRSLPPSLTMAAYTPADLQGTWDYHGLATSGSIGWMHGTIAVDNNGSGLITSRIRNGMPWGTHDNVTFRVPPSGMVGMAWDNTFHGVLTGGRDAMFANWTDNTGANSLMIFRKRQGTFTQSDLYGTWRFHRLTAAGDNVTSGWAYGTLSIGAPGTSTINSIRTSGGSTAELGTSFPVSLDNNGILTAPGDNTFHGAMLPNKNMMVASATEGTGRYELWMMIRVVSGVNYSGNDLMGDWMLHAVVSGNVNAATWNFGQMVVDGTGQADFPAMMGPMGMYSASPMAFAMNSSGIITANAGGMWGMGGGMMNYTLGQTLYGVMSPSKDLAVMTWSDGTGGYQFRINVK